MNKAAAETLWNDLRPAMAQAWEGWIQLHGFDPKWEPQERALFNLNPRLYSEYRIGPTPAMEHGVARAAFIDRLTEHFKRWGTAISTQDIEEYLHPKK